MAIRQIIHKQVPHAKSMLAECPPQEVDTLCQSPRIKKEEEQEVPNTRLMLLILTLKDPLPIILNIP